ncbi:MAG TPA: ATP-dependent DNA ligase [Granulicella sp.]|jgi:DNA ligase-1|nr:ATP-dependent DNA ligase [Granulicella sp.]
MASFRAVAELAEALSRESGRLKKRAAIADAIAAVHREAPGGDDAGLFALYLAGSPFAEADPRKLNAGAALLSRALLQVAGASDAELSAAYRRHGDTGAAAFDLLSGKAGPAATLTLAEVNEAFAAMAVAKTTTSRAALVEGLLRRAMALEAKYLIKLMLGDMRIGVKQSLVEEAIAVAAGVPVAEVRHAVMLEADLAAVVRRAFAGTLAEAGMRLFHPLGFMLASPVETPEEAVERFTGEPDPNREQPRIEAFLEDKYDGMRAQVHCGDPAQPGRVAIYSRNREEVTGSFPELEEAFARVGSSGVGPLAGPLILDGEILGWDREQAQALPFAVLSQRIGRKRVGNAVRAQIPVIFMAFDLLFADCELLLHHPLRSRRNRLEAVVKRLVEVVRSPVMVDERAREMQAVLFASPDGSAETDPIARLLLAPSRLVESAEEIDRAYRAARARANEGVMLKAAGSSYQPGRRGLAWLKLKRELGTLDVVITGAEFGHGRRAGILSDYTFAVRGPRFHQTGELLNVGKAYSGLTDEEIAEMSAWLMAHTIEDQGYFRTVEPLRILEVAFNNIMRSGRHASGFALRFPRILRIRDDKPLEEVDTVERVEEIYQSQVDKPVE